MSQGTFVWNKNDWFADRLAIPRREALPDWNAHVLDYGNEMEMLTVEGFEGERKFFERVQKMRLKVLNQIPQGSEVHVDLGADLMSLYAAYFLATLHGCELSLTVYHPPLIGGDSRYLANRNMLRRKLAMTVLSRAKVAMVHTDQGAQYLDEYFTRANPTIVMTPGALLHEPTEDIADGKQILVLADFYERSGVLEAVRLIAENQSLLVEQNVNVRFLGGGNTEFQNKLMALAKDKIDPKIRVEFYYENNPDAWYVIAQDTAMVILPEMNLTYGVRPMLQVAMAAGACIMAHNSGANPEYLRQMVTGMLFKDAPEMKATFNILMSEPELRAKLATNIHSNAKRMTRPIFNKRFAEIVSMDRLAFAEAQVETGEANG